MCPSKRGWSAVISTKPRGHVEIESRQGLQDLDANEFEEIVTLPVALANNDDDLEDDDDDEEDDDDDDDHEEDDDDDDDHEEDDDDDDDHEEDVIV